MKSPIFLVCFGMVLLMFSQNLTQPFIPLLATSLGASTATVGLVSGVFYLLPALFALVFGVLVDRIGPGRVMLFGTVLLTLATGLLAIAHSLAGVLLAQGISGFGQVASLLGLQSVVANATASGKERTAGYSLTFLWASVGQLTGPLVGGLSADSLGIHAPFAIATAALACSFWPILGISRLDLGGAVAASGEASRPTMRVFRDPWVVSAIAASSMGSMVFAIGSSFYPLFLARAGLSASVIGLLIALRGAVSIGIRQVLPRFRERLGTLRLFSVSLTCLALGTLITPISVSWALLLAESVAIGVGIGINQPISATVIADQATPELRGFTLSTRITANRLLQFAAPFGLGLLGQDFGLGTTFLIGGMLPVLALLLILRMARTVPAAQHTA